MTLLGHIHKNQAYLDASILLTRFLAANQRLFNLKNMASATVGKCKQMQIRCRKIHCMNKIRMCILRQIWNDQKHVMVMNLKKVLKQSGTGAKKKDIAKKKQHL